MCPLLSEHPASTAPAGPGERRVPHAEGIDGPLYEAFNTSGGLGSLGDRPHRRERTPDINAGNDMREIFSAIELNETGVAGCRSPRASISR